MRIVCWNLNKGGSPEAWRYLADMEADLALLQEARIPEHLQGEHAVLHQFARSKNGRKQPWGSAVIAHPRLRISRETFRCRSRTWVCDELEKLGGSFLAVELQTATSMVLVISCHSPAWSLPLEDIPEDELRQVRLKAKESEIWGADLLRSYLDDEVAAGRECIVGGDFNVSILFDETWSSGNQEFVERMAASGLVDCLRKFHTDARSTPTFKNLKGGKVKHQLDYLWATPKIANAFLGCDVGAAEVHSLNISDHLPIVANLDADELMA